MAATPRLLHAARGLCFAGSRTLVRGFVGMPLSSSRAREVDAACAALAESAKAGDERWFERIVGQLRGILEERRAETSAAEAAGSVADPIQDARVGRAAIGGGELPSFEVPGQPTPRYAPQASGSQDASWRQPSYPSDEDQPAWMQALLLLEEAAAHREAASTASPKPEAARTLESGVFLGTRATENASSVFAGARDAEETGEDLAAYLESFHTPGDMEPAWAHALRILEGVGLDEPVDSDTQVPQDGSSDVISGSGGISFGALEEATQEHEHEHAGEDMRMDRYKRLLGDAGDSVGDRARQTRMNAYTDLLEEAERIGRLAPGASIPSRRPNKNRLAPKAKAQSPPPPVSAKASTSPSYSAEAVTLMEKPKATDDPREQARGKGHLVSAVPGPFEDDALDDAELRKEDFVWSEHEFNDGAKANKQTLKRFRREFKAMADATPEGLRNPRLLTAALDLALACVKCYELDKAEAIYRRAIGECRRRGLPWDVKCIQDMATLRCKQNRQADAADLLEELANKAPPHPATFINLGTVYNQLRQYDRAESWFQQAVNLKGGVPGREDHWNLGIVRKNQGRYEDALPMLEQALAEFQEHEPEHPVTIAKLHGTVGGCLHDMGRTAEAAEQYRQAFDLYIATVGKMSPLFCNAAEGLAKALRAERHFEEAFEALLDALEVHARGDAVHPTPLFENLQLALGIHDQLLPRGGAPLARLAPLIDAAVANLDHRGLAEDGNAGLVMSRGGKALLRAGDVALVARAEELLSRAGELIRRSHDAGEADLSHEILEADALLAQARGTLADGS